MPIYRVAITVTEHRRRANIDAPSKREALRLARLALWEDLDDPETVTIKVHAKDVEEAP